MCPVSVTSTVTQHPVAQTRNPQVIPDPSISIQSHGPKDVRPCLSSTPPAPLHRSLNCHRSLELSSPPPASLLHFPPEHPDLHSPALRCPCQPLCKTLLSLPPRMNPSRLGPGRPRNPLDLAPGKHLKFQAFLSHLLALRAHPHCPPEQGSCQLCCLWTYIDKMLTICSETFHLCPSSALVYLTPPVPASPFDLAVFHNLPNSQTTTPIVNSPCPHCSPTPAPRQGSEICKPSL